MSIRIMTEIWEYSPSSGTALLMLLAIADHANDDRECWPSVARLAHMCRIKPRQAQKLIARLIECGELERVIHPGRSLTNTYWIPPYTADEKVSNSAPIAEKVSSSAIKGVLASAPEPSLNQEAINNDRFYSQFLANPPRNSSGNIAATRAVVAFFDLTGWFAGPRIQTQIDHQITDASLPRWRAAIEAWMADGHDPRDIMALLKFARERKFP